MKKLIFCLLFTIISSSANAESTSCTDVFRSSVFLGNYSNSAMHFNHSIANHMLLTPNKSLVSSSKYAKRTQDLNTGHNPSLAKGLGKAWEESDFYYKFNIIKDFPISKVIAAPGHSTLRSVENIQRLSKFINQKGGNHFGNDKLILNIITDSEKNILNVDGWNGHHRLVAYLEAGKKNISQIGDHNLTILVNGNFEAWNRWPHILPAHGVDINKFKSWHKVVGSDDAYAISVDGALSNYALGSRQTVKQVHTNVMRPDQSRVGIVHFSKDTNIENYINLGKKELSNRNYDEIVFVPKIIDLDQNSISKLIEKTANKIKGNNNFNLLINDTRSMTGNFDNKLLEKYIQNLYASKKVSVLKFTEN